MSRVKKYYRIESSAYNFLCTIAGLCGELPEDFVAKAAVARAMQVRDDMIAQQGREAANAEAARKLAEETGDGQAISKADVAGEQLPEVSGDADSGVGTAQASDSAGDGTTGTDAGVVPG